MLQDSTIFLILFVMYINKRFRIFKIKTLFGFSIVFHLHISVIPISETPNVFINAFSDRSRSLTYEVFILICSRNRTYVNFRFDMNCVLLILIAFLIVLK